MQMQKDSKTALAYRVRHEDATGTPILYIHGAMGSYGVWLMLSRHLAAKLPDHPHYLLDLPGHGDSGGGAKDTIDNYARSVIAFADEKKMDRLCLIGHSMGGAISQQIAIDHPQRVEALALIDTGARIGVSPVVIEALKERFDEAILLVKDFAFGPDAPEMFWKPAVDAMRQAGQEAAVADFTACAAFDAVGKIDNYNGPALVCCGEKDLMTSTKNNRRLADSLQCRYVEFAATGHMLPVERPGELAEVLGDFFKGLRAEP